MKVWWFARIFSTTVADLDRDATTSTSIYDRNSIPNFIEDQSFEEIRMMYLEAKMQNNIPAHQMQLAQMINDAKGKLQRLATMSRDILGTLVELYNQQEPSTKPTAG
uniref:Uncharacterized protein n=1 Tax=Anopheles albimanus TaxID=7167 RepID=A0A182F556_ANOAL